MKKFLPLFLSVTFLASAMSGCGPSPPPIATPVLPTATPMPPTPTPLPASDTVCADGCDFTTIQAALDDTSTPSGGATWTHALLSGSPAIDAVSVVGCTVPTDQRGVPRPIVQTSSDTPCDIGAFEHKLMNRAIVWRCFNETIWDEIRVC